MIRRRPIPRSHEMTLLDGTVVREGDKVRAIGGGGGRYRVCTVLEIIKGCGVDKAMLTAPDPFGTVIRTRYQIKRHKKP
jgi:hypothetical protein